VKKKKKKKKKGAKFLLLLKSETKNFGAIGCLEEKETYPRPSSSSSESGLNRSTLELETPVVISISTDSIFFDISVDDESSGVSRIQ